MELYVSAQRGLETQHIFTCPFVVLSKATRRAMMSDKHRRKEVFHSVRARRKPWVSNSKTTNRISALSNDGSMENSARRTLGSVGSISEKWNAA
ncbi:hypothetical protein J3A65_004643 [Rhizobium sp. PvP014]|nr:hypothetical protein [Rhizobium sp. PvP014]MBP2532042.1 hypothetical protein [Rhizobium sp. PvP099]